MNESKHPQPEDEFANASREDIMAALFANMVIQQSNMAMMLLGKVAHPETGQIVQDLEAAKMFIDQLEMLEAKTKGNLSKQEEGLLKQALAALHMAFVEAVESGAPARSERHSEPAAQNEPTPRSASPKSEAPAKSETPAEPAHVEKSAEAADDSRKRFSKKY